MSNPLNDQVVELIREIKGIEDQRDQHLKKMEGEGLLTDIAEEFKERHRSDFNRLDDLTRRIDFLRQKLISLELLMLDNSIKDLHSVTSQVNASTQSLNTTTDKMLKSSTKLESLTTILNYITLMLVIIAIYQVALVLGQSNPLYGAVAIFADFLALIYFMIRVFQGIRSGKIIPLRGKRTEQTPSSISP